MLKRKEKILFIIIFFISAMAAIKILFVGYDIDEQYAVAMSFRMLKGDFPIKTMWEPHQTSGFLAAIIMLPYLLLVKTTNGIVLYTRICGLVIHSLVTFCFYKALSKIQNKKYSVLLSLVFFFTLPKIMFFPEFSNILIWSTALIMAFFLNYYLGKHAKGWLILIGVLNAFATLAYPSCVILFFMSLIVVVINYRTRIHSENKSLLKEIICICLPCVLGAAIFICIIMTQINISELPMLVKYVLSDGSHSASFTTRLITNAKSLVEICIYIIIYGMISAVLYFVCKRIKKIKFNFTYDEIFLLVTFLGQLIIWLFGNQYPNYPLVEYFIIPLLGVVRFVKNRKNISADKFLYTAILFFIPLSSFVGVILATNHPILVSSPFLCLTSIGIFVLMESLNDGRIYNAELKKSNGISEGEKYKKNNLVEIIIIAWLGVHLIGNIYLVRVTAGEHYTIKNDLTLIKSGPAAGIICDSKTAKKTMEEEALVLATIESGSKVFYMGPSNDIYLAGDYIFSTPSTISSPTFDDKINDYFEINPEKRPEYIICDIEALYTSVWMQDYIYNSGKCMLLAENDHIRIFSMNE